MFSRPNPFDQCVTAATDENLTSENWELILAVTDKATRSSPESARECVNAVEKRLNNRIPNVQLYAMALIEAMVKNCDITVHREISSRSFTSSLVKLVKDRTVHVKVRQRILEFIQMCSFEFRADSTLGLMNEVYNSLRADGIQFPSPQKPKKEFTQSELDKQKEEDEFQLALALSLSESENKKNYRSYTTTSTTQATTATKAKEQEEKPAQPARVRALYDFQPTEEGELGFEKGDIIRVVESVYRDWWKGELRGSTGIFPVNYVEKIVDQSPADIMKEASMENDVMAESENIDRLLDILSRVDPSKDSFSDNDELQKLYHSSLSIRPKLVKLIEKYSLKKDELVALNEKFMQARGIYDTMLSSSLARYSAPTSSYGFAPMYNNNNNNSINPSYDQNQYNNNTYNQNNYQSAPTAQPYYADPQSQTPQQPPQSTFNYNNSNQPYSSENHNTNQQQPPYNPQQQQQQQQQPTSYVQNY